MIDHLLLRHPARVSFDLSQFSATGEFASNSCEPDCRAAAPGDRRSEMKSPTQQQCNIVKSNVTPCGSPHGSSLIALLQRRAVSRDLEPDSERGHSNRVEPSSKHKRLRHHILWEPVITTTHLSCAAKHSMSCVCIPVRAQFDQPEGRSIPSLGLHKVIV